MFLAEVYIDHGEALEWDLFQYWNMDINDPSLTIRRLRNFVDRLPFDSETLQDIGKISREARQWDTNTFLLANIYDAIEAGNFYFMSAHSKHSPAKPKPLPRPEIKKKKSVPTGQKKKVNWPGKTIYTPKE